MYNSTVSATNQISAELTGSPVNMRLENDMGFLRFALRFWPLPGGV
jgi:hypothetical protein